MHPIKREENKGTAKKQKKKIKTWKMESKTTDMEPAVIRITIENVLINRQSLSYWVKNNIHLSQARNSPEMLKARVGTGCALSDTSSITKHQCEVRSQVKSRRGSRPDCSLVQTPKAVGQDAWISSRAYEADFGRGRGAFLQETVKTGSAVSPGTVIPPPWVGHTLRSPLASFQGGDPPKAQEDVLRMLT